MSMSDITDDVIKKSGLKEEKAIYLENIMVDYRKKVANEKPSDLKASANQYFMSLPQEEMKVSEPSDINETTKRRASIMPYNFDMTNDDTNRNTKSSKDTSEITSNLAKSYIFRNVPLHELEIIAEYFHQVNVSPGQTVIHQGDAGKVFYVVGHGKLEAIKNGITVHIYKNEGSFGELALLYNRPRSATIRAITHCRLWAIEGRDFRREIRKAAMKTTELYVGFINNVHLFKEMSEQEKYKIADTLTLEYFTDGQCIIKQGESANCMYFVKEGSVKIVMNFQNKLKALKVCYKGDYFGELALLVSRPRAASAYAVGNTVVAKLDVSVFEQVIGKCKDIMMRNIREYELVLRELIREN